MHDAPSLRGDERLAIDAWRWFAGLSAATRHDLLRSARVRRFRSGAVIAEQGSLDCEWLACAAGSVRIASTLANGKEAALTYIQPGVWFADPGLFLGKRASQRAVAFGETTVLGIPSDRFFALLAGNAELSMAVMRLQAHHVRSLYQALNDVSTLPLRPRVARQIGLLAKKYRPHDARPGEGGPVGLRLTQGALAELVRCSRQRVNVELKELERSGLLHMERGRVVVHDADALCAASGDF